MHSFLIHNFILHCGTLKLFGTNYHHGMTVCRVLEPCCLFKGQGYTGLCPAKLQTIIIWLVQRSGSHGASEFFCIGYSDTRLCLIHNFVLQGEISKLIGIDDHHDMKMCCQQEPCC